MSKQACPLCGSKQFYIKDPEDEYELYEFEYLDGKVIPDQKEEDMSLLSENTETYCNKCSWHDKFKALIEQS